jgi:hypothetical protein
MIGGVAIVPAGQDRLHNRARVNHANDRKPTSVGNGTP